jgi:hypothetical protein
LERTSVPVSLEGQLTARRNRFEALLFIFHEQGIESVKFTIEIYSTDDGGSETLLHRTTITAINPLLARKAARHLFIDWKRRKATGARLLNAQGERLWNWTE